MTMTDNPPVADSAASDDPVVAPTTGVDGLLRTTDHKTIGRVYLAVALLMALGAAAVGVVIGFERLDGAAADDLFGGVNAYFQFWVLYRVAIVAFVAMPLWLGIAFVIVPMQVGANNIAFPRAAQASLWGWLFGAIITVVSVFSGGGWGALDGVSAKESDAIALTLVGTGLTLVSLLLGAVCVATTVISLRTSGMTLQRTPLFAWSMLVSSAVWLFTVPIVVVNLVIVYADLRGRPPIAFGIPDPTGVGIWNQLDWIVEQPAIYALAVPVIGVAGSILPVAASIRQRAHGALMVATGAFGLLAIGGWSQPALAASDERDGLVYVVFGLAAVLPVLYVVVTAVGNLAESRGKGRASTTMVLASVGALVMLTVAVVAGALRVIEPFELLETSVDTAIINATAIAVLLGSVAAIWFWSSKLFGCDAAEGSGRLVVVMLTSAGLMMVLADATAGFFDGADLLLAVPERSIVEQLTALSFLASLAVLGAVAITVVHAARAIAATNDAADDPWGGHTLEWATASPPSTANFEEPPPIVRSAAPLLDEATDEGAS